MNLQQECVKMFMNKIQIYQMEMNHYLQLNQGNVIKAFHPDPKTVPKKKFPSEPKTHSEIRDTTQELNSQTLLKICAGPVKLEFGNIFVKSMAIKYFQVRNELRNCISARIYSDKEDLAYSYMKPQIIPSGQTAGFDICICSKQLGMFKSHLKYIINEKHIFELQFGAIIEKVFLEMNNAEMETSEILRLNNNGNAEAKFKWITSEKKLFYVEPEEGIVASGKYLECQIFYCPSFGGDIQYIQQITGQQQQQYTAAITKTEDEKIILKTEESIDQSVKCIGMLNKVRQISRILYYVSLSLNQFVQKIIRNLLQYFQLNHKIECLEIIPMKGKILSDETKDIQVKFFSKEEKTIKGDIVIQIRGGKIINIPFSATSIIPKIEIEQDIFDFGNVTTLGTSNQIPLTFINSSPVSIQEHQRQSQSPDGIECLEIKPQDEEEKFIHSIHPDQEEDEPKEEDPLDDNANVSDNSEPIQIESKQFKQYNITIAGGKTLQFHMRFSPKDVKQYSFDIPITLARYGPLSSLMRKVKCRGLKPKFLVEPQLFEFKKKIITSPDKCFPTVEEIKLSNPDRKDVHWKIDCQSLKSEKIFAIEPNEGVVPSGQQINIRVKFNLYGPGSFNGTIQLYILEDPEIPSTLPYVEITMSGSGAYLRLLFDKKEVILPVVPLNIQSKCYFRVINDSYENLNLKYNWAEEISNFNLEFRFPEGSTLGVAKNKLTVEVVFSNKKPISFTTRVEFIDEAKVYIINISGTTDNCIFTNQSFL
ncbi:unnamed protein product [Paramecium sonneborni]|uniref:Uncharacterized protein n=1 Tax=Paramecium sonneborni TaxID=65129 RepID=A0A8S1R0L1_9CILI|nr:unnamed protein product [Paramecium sonneborni]